ncbi:MAG TPA: hypothetical protein VGG74_35960 [Kofleriaceae bacterium]|jgi:hypothetical protein
MVRVSCAVLAVVFACGPSHNKSPDAGSGPSSDAPPGDGGIAPHTLSQIVVSPTNPIVQLDLNVPGAQAFTATGVYADGTTDDVTTQVTWSIANSAVGTMTGATLIIPSFSNVTAVVSTVSASVGSVTGKGQITVVAYRQTGEQQDFFFVLPYEDGSGSQSKPLDFSTAIASEDVFFLMDTTGSMQDEINNLQTSLTTTGGVIDTILATEPDTQFGVGAMEDFPLTVDSDQYGETTATCVGTLPYSPNNGDGTDDQPFKLRQAITSNASDVQTALNGLTHPSKDPGSGSYQLETIGCGGDTPEAGFEAVYQAVTGAGLPNAPAPTNVPPVTIGYRQGSAMPVIVELSDAISHGTNETVGCGSGSLPPNNNINYDPSVTGAHSRSDAATALENVCGRFVGVAPVKACDAEEYMTYLATQSGARVPPVAWDFATRPANCGSGSCCTGQNGSGMAPDADGLCPLVFRVSTLGTGVGTSVSTGIEMLTRFALFDVPTEEQGVTTDIDGNMLPGGHTTADFLKSVVPSSYMLPPPPPNVPPPTIDANGIQFDGVTPGTKVTFTINAFNDFVPQTNVAQVFSATIEVLAGGCNVLDSRSVLILVPPSPIVLQ